jgi:hypothetical protein
MRVFTIHLLALMLVSACSNAATDHGMDHGSMQRSNLAVNDVSSNAEIAFAVVDGQRNLTQYTVTHTKEMHLIVVRDDLTHFSHLHPERDADGVWRVPFSASAGGTYWLFADFADASGKSHTLRFERDVPGAEGSVGFTPHPGNEKTVDEFTVDMSPVESADYVEFPYTVRDAAGNSAMLEEYLEEKGHSILLSKDGDFVHTHPQKEYVGYSPSDSPVFIVPRNALRDDFYRIFTQFQIDGRVITVDFDWQKVEG